MPRWSDDPTHILGVLANYLRLDDPALAPDRQFSRAEAEAEAQVARLVAEARARGRLRGAMVRAALRRTRLFAGLRELPKYHIVVALAEVRRQLTRWARSSRQRADRRGRRHLLPGFRRSARQALDGADMQETVARRQGAYDLELGRRHIPRVLLSDGTEPEALPLPCQPGRPPMVH